MRSERLRWLVKAEGPFASVYFDDSHDTLDAVEQLEAKWRDIRKHLEDLGAVRKSSASSKKPCCTIDRRWVGAAAR